MSMTLRVQPKNNFLSMWIIFEILKLIKTKINFFLLHFMVIKSFEKGTRRKCSNVLKNSSKYVE